MASTMWQGMLFTDDNNADANADVDADNSDDNAAWLH